MLPAGKLRHRVTIQELVSTQNDSNGNVDTSWMAFAANLPADVHPLSGREFIAAGAEQSEIVQRIVIRYLAGVKVSMRVLHGAKVFDVKAALADPDSGREYITLHVSEVKQEG